MPSSIFGNRTANNMNQKNMNPLKMLAEFKKFSQGMTPEKAEKKINELLESGQMSREQFENLKEQAKTFMQFLK